MYFSDDTKDLLSALSKAQGEFKVIPFDKVNPHFKSKYASLSATIEMIRPILAKHGLSYMQFISTNENSYFVDTVLAHSSGQKISSSLRLIVGRNDMQGLGSAVTYAKRYALQSILGIAGDEDDDGNQAAKEAETKKKNTEKMQSPPKSNQYQKFSGHHADFVMPLSDLKGKKLGELDHAQLAKIREWTTGQLKAKPRPKNIAQIADLHDNVKKMQADIPPADEPHPDFVPQDFPNDEQLPPEAYSDNPFDDFQDQAPRASEVPNLAPPSGEKKKSNDDGPGAFILPKMELPRGFQNLWGKRLDSFQPATLDTYMKALKAESVKTPKPPNVSEMFGVIGKIKAYLETF